MGTIYSVRCPDCGYSAEYFCGVGMLDFKGYDIDGELPQYENDLISKPKRKYKKKTLFEKIQCGYHGKQIKKLFAEHPASEWSTDTILGRTTPYYCKKCEKIRFRYTKQISWEDQDDYQCYIVPELCSVCKTEMALPEEQTEPIKCPKCNSHNAYIGKSGLWD